MIFIQLYKFYKSLVRLNAYGINSLNGYSLILPSESCNTTYPSSINSERNCLHIPHGYVRLSDEDTIAILLKDV